MYNTNPNVRKAAKKAGIPLWAIAYELNISEATMTRMLRKELTKEQEQSVLQAIKILSSQKGGKNE